MNLYEFEGKQLFKKYGITIPRGVVVYRNESIPNLFEEYKLSEVVVKAQVLSGKRGKNNAIRFCNSQAEVETATQDLFAMEMLGQYVAAVRIEEKLDIAAEHYLSITYDTNQKEPVIVYSVEGGMDIETVSEEKIQKKYIDLTNPVLPEEIPCIKELWACFLKEDARQVEINPLVQTTSGDWIAADAKVALDDDAMHRHTDREFAARTMMGRIPTKREVAVAEIDSGEKYYQGTAGKYIEMEGDIAILFSGGGASIANMDALIATGLEPANYTEYSGNPPREKVYELAKIVLSKPNLRGLWVAGGVANFTDVRATFQGIVDALDEIKPMYSIVVRRAGPNEKAGMQLMHECAKRNNLNMKLFGKEKSMSETAIILADMVRNT